MNHLIKIKPNDTHTYRVVTIISIENYGDRKLSYLKTMTTFKNFSIEIMNFKIISSSNEINFGKHGNFNCPTAQPLHFQEVIYDEDTIDKKRFGLLRVILKGYFQMKSFPFSTY